MKITNGTTKDSLDQAAISHSKYFQSLYHYLCDSVQEAEEHGDVGVAAGGGHDVHVADLNSDGDNDDLGNNGDTTHLDVGEGALLGLNQGTAVILLLHVGHKSCKQNIPG